MVVDVNDGYRTALVENSKSKDVALERQSEEKGCTAETLTNNNIVNKDHAVKSRIIETRKKYILQWVVARSEIDALVSVLD